MTKRVFWVALGATVGILVVAKGSKALRRLSPASLAHNVSDLPEAISGRFHEFADEVRLAAAEREFELYRVLAVDTPEHDADTRGA